MCVTRCKKRSDRPSKGIKDALDFHARVDYSSSYRAGVGSPGTFTITAVVVVLLLLGWANGFCSAANDPPQIKVGSELDFPPYAFTDDKGQPVGFSVDLIKAVAQTMNLPIKITTGTWDNLWNALVAGRLDILPIVAKLPDRLPLVDFSLPHTETYDAFFVRPGNPPLKNIEAAQGKDIVVMRSDAAHHALLGHNFQGNLVVVDTIPAGLSLIAAGKHDAFLCSKLIGTMVLKNLGNSNLVAGPVIPDYKRVFSFAVKKGDVELLEKLNQGLLIIKTNGEYDRIYEKWLAIDDPWRTLEKYFLPIIVTAIVLVLVVCCWLLSLHLLVKKRTRELVGKNQELLIVQDGLEVEVTKRTAELSDTNVTLQTEIAERKQAEEALQKEQEFLKALLESIDDGVVACNADGVLTLFNRATREFHSLSETPLSSNGWTDCYDLYLPDGITKMQQEDIPLYRAIQGEHIRNVEMVIAPKQGRKRTLLASGKPFYDSAKRKLGAVVSMHDITENKQLEAQLVQAQKMEAIGILAGGIAHDFNNILWAIMGFTEMSLLMVPQESKIQQNLQQVMEASKRAKYLVHQILAFSRKNVQEKRPLQISSIVKEAVKLLRASIPTTIDIQTNITAPHAMVMADPTQIHQVIMNLCTNAAQAMGENGGVLEVKLEECYLDNNFLMKHYDLAPGYYVILTVRDTGHGIEPKILDRIFEPFFTTKGVGEGTGMGLAAVHGIVKSHGGEITVSSQPGKGATFTVFLCKIVNEEIAEVEDLTPLPTGNDRVLVADDEEVLVNLVKEMLESLGYAVVAQNSSLEALKTFQHNPDQFDLVITDQTMPHMTGIQLSQAIRRIRPDVPIVLCTGYSETVSHENVEAAGINELLMKPVTLRSLAETVHKVLDKKIDADAAG